MKRSLVRKIARTSHIHGTWKPRSQHGLIQTGFSVWDGDRKVGFIDSINADEAYGLIPEGWIANAKTTLHLEKVFCEA